MTSTRWTFAVIADSHFHPPGVPQQAAFQSDRLFNDRNAAAVALLKQAAPELVVHLGDVPHPVPGLADHHRALDEAARVYGALDVPLLVVPGNHDVGDKPHPWAPAPSVSVQKHAVFSERWGPPWWSREHRGLRLIGVDTPILNSGLPLEDEQWAWLEAELARGGPTLVFLHYPPFLLHPDEPEHYDNLAAPARGRLLELFTRHDVRAVFCGHVHHPFWHAHGGMDWYLLPSTAFVRPGFAELARIGPGDEHGRNDGDRLGFCLVHVDGDQVQVEWVWTRGATTVAAVQPALRPGAPATVQDLGVTLRHAWDAVLDVPADNLDPFRRKQARNDLALLAAWTAGVRLLRLPLEDLRREQTRQRLVALAAKGFRALFFTAEALTEADVALLDQHQDFIAGLELVLPRAFLDRPRPTLPVTCLVAPTGVGKARDGAYYSHFLPHGFTLDDPDLARVPDDGIVLRIEARGDLFAALEAAAALAVDRPVEALVHLPRAGEATMADDDTAVARLVTTSVLAARAFPHLTVVLDGFEDHDRGYFPRHSLVDRRGNPRAGWHVLHHLGRLLPAEASVTPVDGGFEVAGLGTVRLDGGRGLDLVTGLVGEVLGPVVLQG